MKIADLIESLQIFAKYEDKGTDAYINGADHDVIYGFRADIGDQVDVISMKLYVYEHGEYPTVLDLRMTAEDNARIRELGWFIDPDSESWWHYT